MVSRLIWLRLLRVQQALGQGNHLFSIVSVLKLAKNIRQSKTLHR
jgi:hypothetical protein